MAAHGDQPPPLQGVDFMPPTAWINEVIKIHIYFLRLSPTRAPSCPSEGRAAAQPRLLSAQLAAEHGYKGLMTALGRIPEHVDLATGQPRPPGNRDQSTAPGRG